LCATARSRSIPAFVGFSEEDDDKDKSRMAQSKAARSRRLMRGVKFRAENLGP